MPDTAPQTYANHVRRDGFALAIALMTLVPLLLVIAGVFIPVLSVLGMALLVMLFFAFQLKARIYSLTVQDRIIRLEMQLRLERVLPEDLRERARGLTLSQLVALRFASDAELPGLVEKVLAGELTTGDAIKRAVTDWQPDTLRV